jgi:hypothetical protein
MRRLHPWLCAYLWLLVPAHAQTPINAPGAMQPSTNTGIYHVMPMYRKTSADAALGIPEADEYVLLSQIAYGIRNNFSIQLDAPLVYRDIQTGGGAAFDDSDFGFADSTLLAKWRLYQHDPAPTETVRFSVIGGLQIPGDGSVEFEMDSSNDAWDPIVGGVFSAVFGRHGFNADALWEFYTGDDDGPPEHQSDSLRYDASHLFRIAPAEYSAQSTGALYAVTELNGFYGTNGDHEVFIAPGVMYESRKFTLDATVMIPVHQELEHRAETELIVAVGLRLSF